MGIVPILAREDALALKRNACGGPAGRANRCGRIGGAAELDERRRAVQAATATCYVFSRMNEPAVTAAEFLQLLRATMPAAVASGVSVEIPARGELVARLPHDDRRLRPGGTLSGPTLFMMVDLAFYGVTLSIVGMEPLAVTADISIHFLRKPPPAELVCKARVLKAGRRLVTADALVYTAGSDEPVAHGVGTYSVPRRETP